MRKVYITLFTITFILFAQKGNAQYCIPGFTTGCTFGGTNLSGDLIHNVSTTGGVTNISNLATGCPGPSYTYYSTMGASQIQGQIVNFNVQAGPAYNQGFRIWIDWNNNFSFQDPGEDVFVSVAPSTAPQTGSFTVPFSALPGLKRMRVLCRFAIIPNATDDCGTGMAYGECEDYNFTVIAATPCTGQPTAGTAASTITTPCSGQNFTLTLNGTTAAGGLTYQWIESTTGNPGTWTLVTGATQNFHSTSSTTNMCYRCIVTCSTSTLFDTSSSICVSPVPFSPFSTCYCPVTNAGSSCITNVTFNTLTNTSTGCTTPPSNYVFYTTPITNLVQGLSYLFSVATNGNAISSVWIDYNHNSVFEPSEWYQPDINSLLGDTLISIPLTSLPGQTRMRVRSRITGNQNGSGDACIAMGSGETEDYIVNILPAVPHDPAVLQMNTPNSNCFSQSSNVSVIVTNYGQQPINLSLNPVTVYLNINGPNGPITPAPQVTLNSGTLQASGANTVLALITGVNMYAGGLYTLNTDLTIGNAGGVMNGIEADDSLAAPITLQNYRPKPGPAYQLCQNQSIPLGQGLTVSGCATPIIDSVTVTMSLLSATNIPCLPTQNAITGACHFAAGALPVLPNPTFISAQLTVTNLATSFGGFPSETRFPLFRGAVPFGTPLHQTGIGNPTNGSSTNYTWTYNIPIAGSAPNLGFPAIYDTIMSGGGILNLGYNSSWVGNATNNGFTMNAGSPTTVKLKIKYSYVPNNYVWFETPAGGTSIFNSSPFDPLSVSNNVVSNSATPGTYMFYVACGPSPNCRAADTLVVNASPIANNASLSNCEDAVASNNSTFDLTTLSSIVSPSASNSILYAYDPGFFLAVPAPNTLSTGTGNVYVKVTDPLTQCSTPVQVSLVVDTLPDIVTVSQAFICAPASLNAQSLIDPFSIIPSGSIFSYYTNPACTIPHPNPTAITSAGIVYIVASTNTTPSCHDTAAGIINISSASGEIVNQEFAGTFTYSSPTSVNPIGTTYATYTDGQTSDVVTPTCERVAGLKDILNGISLGVVAVDEIIEAATPIHNLQPFLKRHFKITPTNQDSAQVCLYFLQSDFDDYNFDAPSLGFPQMSPTLANIAVSKVDNGDFNTPGHTVTVIPSSAITTSYSGAPNEIWTVCFNVDSFSYFYVHTQNPGNVALSVLWHTFTAKRVEATSVLQWATSQENNNDYFVIERSRDAKFFNIISGQIASKGINGYSANSLQYEYIDATPHEGNNYYRIRQFDKDGKESISKVQQVYFGNEAQVKVYPNPVKDEVHIDILVAKPSNATVSVLDGTGRIVRTIQSNLTVGNNILQLNMQGLAQGIYTVKVSNPKGLHYTQTIRKD